ncbi:MAG TPA: DNA-binding protein [Candidatus Bathyarchaeota archaeon]|nr:DNA-binding protein [Candidatus Bathyarchaeota archaeon]HEX68906.1 DNA-binding protein [Candidatus Bathyarchaeota archaeon]
MKEGKIGRIVFSRIFEDEDLLEGIKKRVKKLKAKAGLLFLIGSLKEACLGFYEKGKYKRVEVKKPLEIASCMGNISVKENGELVIHAHMVVSDKSGNAYGGHLLKGCKVAATAELMLIEVPEVDLKRKFEDKYRLYLLNIEK